MIQDFEGFPREFYHESHIDFVTLVKYLSLDDHERECIEVRLRGGEEPSEALANKDDVTIYESEDEIVECYLADIIPEEYWWTVHFDRVSESIRSQGNYIDIEDGRVAEIY